MDTNNQVEGIIRKKRALWLVDAAREGDAAVVNALVGVDPKLVLEADERGDTAWHSAAERGLVDIMSRLHQLNPQVASITRGHARETGLHVAASAGQTDAVKWLLQLPLSKEILHRRNSAGALAADCARRQGDLEAADLIDEEASKPGNWSERSIWPRVPNCDNSIG